MWRGARGERRRTKRRWGKGPMYYSQPPLWAPTEPSGVQGADIAQMGADGVRFDGAGALIAQILPCVVVFLLLNHRLRQPELICSTIQGVAYKVKVPATASGGSTGLQQRNRGATLDTIVSTTVDDGHGPSAQNHHMTSACDRLGGSHVVPTAL